MPAEAEARDLCQQVLKRVGSNPAEVLFFTVDSALTRFANNSIHQNVSERDTRLVLRYFEGKRAGLATTNRLDAAGLDEIVTKARAIAHASTEDPDQTGLPGPAHYSPVQAYDEQTAQYTPARRAQAVGVVCQMAKEKGLNASGAFSTGVEALTVANSEGLFAYHQGTTADFQIVVMGADASGRAHRSGWCATDLPVELLGKDAVYKAERGQNPRKVEPGEYTVVIEPSVTEDLLDQLNFHGIGAQTVIEGRSWMNDRIGQKVMSSLVNIWDDGLDPKSLPLPFDFEGVPKQRVDIVREGVIQGPVYDRYTGQKTGAASTGHALEPELRSIGPLALNLFMGPGESSVEDLIRSTRRGLYINRFWYTRLVHPRDCVITGMTRDGVFMIEDGELVYPVKNLRFTQSYVQALNDVDAIGSETSLMVGPYIRTATRVPALKISRFNFTGVTV